MSSPLPGMNPYLESPELWSEFHSRMIVAIADALDELLSRAYRVAVEKRVYLSQTDESLLIGIPDVAIVAPPIGNRRHPPVHNSCRRTPDGGAANSRGSSGTLSRNP
jgi:Protein of unknown function (DUF4058)